MPIANLEIISLIQLLVDLRLRGETAGLGDGITRADVDRQECRASRLTDPEQRQRHTEGEFVRHGEVTIIALSKIGAKTFW